MSTLIHHDDIKAFTGKRNRVFCIILVLSASCALYFIFCFKQNSSFGNNVLRPSYWRHFIFLLSQSFVSVSILSFQVHFSQKSTFQKIIWSDYSSCWRIHSVALCHFLIACSSYWSIMANLFSWEKRSSISCLSSKKYSHLRLGKQEFPPSKEFIFLPVSTLNGGFLNSRFLLSLATSLANL